MTDALNQFTVVTLFPELIEAFSAVGIVRRACERGHVVVQTINPRSFTLAGTGRVDDAPYGGGPGMVMMVAPLRAAITSIRERGPATVAYLTPQGRRIDQSLLGELTRINHLVLVAGRYEGIDERVIERDIDLELSLGDFVLSGGEIAAMAVMDGIIRLLPGSLGSDLSAQSDSFTCGLLEHAQYTRPEIIDGQPVPAVLLSGNHAEIQAWRQEQRLSRTLTRRPDLLATAKLSEADQAVIAEMMTKKEDLGE
ncbi:MAG: tRNA (guanosine(37)-N1)-methyltransferase TrmD [Proteobacteria bacterium]|nr:tRNA (guanosine(37)-N1)-methyltransferase TrmD [Pseudomonadota bacterium]